MTKTGEPEAGPRRLGSEPTAKPGETWATGWGCLTQAVGWILLEVAASVLLVLGYALYSGDWRLAAFLGLAALVLALLVGIARHRRPPGDTDTG